MMKKAKKVSRVGGSKVTPRPRATASESEMTQAAVEKRIRGLVGNQRFRTICALVGHSRIQTHCFGYYNCARCGDQVGDALGSIYEGASGAVIVGHDCEVCRKNAKTLTWRDTFDTPDPFAEAV